MISEGKYAEIYINHYHLRANVNLLPFFSLAPSLKSPRNSHIFWSSLNPSTEKGSNPSFILLLKILSIVSLNISSIIRGISWRRRGLASSMAGLVLTSMSQTLY